MSQPIYVVDAFTSKPFAGNPAGVCPISEIKSDEWMHQVAAEMKHAETAFVRPVDDGFELRWFTPTIEVDLCGHATLATAQTLWSTGRHPKDESIRFHTRSGLLTASPGMQIELDFPAIYVEEAPLPHSILGLQTVWSGHNGMDWLVEVDSEETIKSFVPQFDNIGTLGKRGLIVTSQGSDPYDFVSRFFAPQSGVPEDPVTGSAHCCLATYWQAKLKKNSMVGYQASLRGGEVGVEIVGSRVLLRGNAVTVLEGILHC